MIEIILNRLRGTGDVFYISRVPIIGTVLYAFYMALVVGLFQGLFFNYVIITNII